MNNTRFTNGYENHHERLGKQKAPVRKSVRIVLKNTLVQRQPVEAVPDLGLPRLPSPSVGTTVPKEIARRVLEGDIIPNPNIDVGAARANVLRAFGEVEALK